MRDKTAIGPGTVIKLADVRCGSTVTVKGCLISIADPLPPGTTVALPDETARRTETG